MNNVLCVIFLSLFCIAGQSTGGAQVVIPAAGYINTIAGSGSIGSSGDGGSALLADFKYPTQAVVDSSGNIYIADYGNNRIQKVTASTGLMSTYAGTGTAGSGGVPGVATSAGLSSPYSLAIDGANNLYISDYGNNRILKVNTSGQISLVAGSITGVAGYSGDTQLAVNALLDAPYGIAADSAGDVFIVDYANHRIREVNVLTGDINTVAGNGTSSSTRPANGASALTSSFDQPYAVAVDSAGNLYITDHGTSTIYKVAAGSIYYFAGTGTAGYSGDNVAATTTKINNPTGLSVDAWGNIFFADTANNRIREVNTNGIITTIAGNGTMAFLGDKGLATSAEVAQPSDVQLDSAGNLYIDDYSNERIRAVGVVKATPTVGLSLSPTSVVYGAENATFSATVPTGSSTVTFSNGSGWTSGALAVTGGTVTSSISNATWAAGSYTISAAYAGNAEYQATTTPATFTVTKATPTLSVTSSDLTVSYGSSVTFTATISSGATGSITFLDSGSSIGTGTISGTTATFTTTTLAVGTHTITASYAASTDFNAVTSSSIAQTVTKATPTLSVTSSGTPAAPGASVKFTATISSGPTGTITFYDSGTSIGTGTISGTAATFTTTTLALGSHSITAGYAGGTDYNSVTSSVFTQAILATPTLSVATSGTPTTYGTSVTFTATISAGPTGSITFYDSGTSIGTGTISSGKATLAISTLTGGTHSITAGYGGNPDYGPVTSSAISQVVNKATPTITLATSVNPSAYGAAVTFTAMLPTGPTGSVTFYSGSTSLGSGTVSSTKATLTTTSLALGTDSITAKYSGDTNYNTVTSSALSQVVNKATPTLTVATSATPSAYGSAVTFTATISNNATGTITFSDSGTSIGSGTISGSTATYTTSSLAAGAHTITASYAANTDFNAVTSSPITQTVNKVTPTLTVSSSVNPSSYSQSVTFTAAISNGATGTVTFYDSGTSIGTGTISSGSATFAISTLATGTHTITVGYAANTDFNAVTSSPLTQTVKMTLPTISVSTSVTPTIYSTAVTFTALLSSGPTGTVTFYDSSTIIGTGTISGTSATLTIATLTAGSHSITAYWPGNPNYNAVTSSAIIQTVTQATPTITLSSTATGNITYGTPVTLTANITPTIATGTMTFKAGSTVLGTVSLAGGTAALTTSTIPAGTTSVSVIYSGDSNDASSSATIAQVVTVATPTLSLSSSTYGPITYGTTITLSATITPSAATGSINFTTSSGGTIALCTAPITVGTASCTTNVLPAGTLTISASYLGDANDSATSATLSTPIVVNQAVLTLTAANQEITYGAAIPELTYAINGFVLGQCPAPDPNRTSPGQDCASPVTSGTPDPSTTAELNSQPGQYPITIEQGSFVITSPNYTANYVDGQLAISANTPTITIQPGTATYGSQIQVLITVSNSNQQSGAQLPSGSVTVALLNESGATVETLGQNTINLSNSGQATWYTCSEPEEPAGCTLLSQGPYSLNVSFNNFGAYYGAAESTQSLPVAAAPIQLYIFPGTAQSDSAFTAECIATVTAGLPSPFSVVVTASTAEFSEFTTGALDNIAGSTTLEDTTGGDYFFPQSPNPVSIFMTSGLVFFPEAFALYTQGSLSYMTSSDHTLIGTFTSSDSNYASPDDPASCAVTVTPSTSGLNAVDSPTPLNWQDGQEPEITFTGTVTSTASEGAAKKQQLSSKPHPMDGTPPVPTGTITLTDSAGTNLGSCTFDSDGVCSFTFSPDMFPLPDDADGPYSYGMTASYEGDANYDPATATFSQTVNCETDVQDTDSYSYTDEEESNGAAYYYVTAWVEDKTATTYNCLGNQIGDPTTSEIDSGTDDCSYTGYSYYECDDYGNEWESDEYACSHGSEGTVDDWTDYYPNGYICD